MATAEAAAPVEDGAGRHAPKSKRVEPELHPSAASQADRALRGAKAGTRLEALTAGLPEEVRALAQASHQACLVWNEVHATEVCCTALSDLRHYVSQLIGAVAAEAAAGPTAAIVCLGGVGASALACSQGAAGAGSLWLVQPRKCLREVADLLRQWHHLPPGRLRTVPYLSESVGEVPLERRWILAVEGLEAHGPAQLLGPLQEAMQLGASLGAEVVVQPEGLRVLAQPVEVTLTDVEGFDLSEVHRRFAEASSACHFAVSAEDRARAFRPLAEPKVAFPVWEPGTSPKSLPLRHAQAVDWEVTAAGRCEAVVFWFEASFGARSVDSRGGPAGRCAVQLLPGAVEVRPGAPLRAAVGFNGSRVWFDVAGCPPPAASVPAYLPFWHTQMLVDAERNRAYQRALERQCRGKCVAEIGSGSGLLLMMAMRAGAKEAVGCEVNHQLAETAQTVLRQNGFAEGSGVTLHHADARDLALSRRYDVLLAELMDYTGLGENLASLFAEVRPRWLAPGGRVIPGRLRLYAFLIEWPFPRLQKDLDLSLLELFSSNSRHSPFCSMGGTDSVPAALNANKDWHLMSDVVEFLDLDLQGLSEIKPEGPRPVIFHATQSGIVNAVAWFFVCDLDDEVSICTAPVGHPAFESFNPVSTHWYQAMQSVGPLVVVPGQEVNLGFKHDGVVIDWLMPCDVSLAHARLARRLFERAGAPSATIDALQGWFRALQSNAHRELEVAREKVRATLCAADCEMGREQRRFLLGFISQLGELGHSTNCADRLLGLCCAPPWAPTGPAALAGAEAR